MRNPPQAVPRQTLGGDGGGADGDNGETAEGATTTVETYSSGHPPVKQATGEILELK